MSKEFMERGYSIASDLLTPAQRKLIMKHYRYSSEREKASWTKGWVAADRFYYDVATRPAILDLIRPMLGPNIILWAGWVLERKPGELHGWHTDAESSDPNGRFVSVWIGLENTSRESGLKFIGGSHRFGKSVQQERAERSIAKNSATDEDVLAWAQELDPKATLEQPDVQDGDAILFDGRIWHGSRNDRSEGTRAALLLQYATAECPIRRPNERNFEWPFEFLEDKSVPVMVLEGEGDPRVNKIVRPPQARRLSQDPVMSEVLQLRLPFTQTEGEIFTPRLQLSSPTGNHNFLRVHVSVLEPGHSPHVPEGHIEEEIFVILKGEAELVAGEGYNPEQVETFPLKAGSLIYFPAHKAHTIRNVGEVPVQYLIFKWLGSPFEARDPMCVTVVHTEGLHAEISKRGGYGTRLLFEQETNYLSRLQAHLTEMPPEAGYAPHRDRHDVAIILFEGELLANETRIEPCDVAYYSGGALHGLKNIGETTSRYLVFEFERPGGPRPIRRKKFDRRGKRQSRRGVGRFTPPKAVRQKLKTVLPSSLRALIPEK